MDNLFWFDNNVYICACTKSEDDSTPMIRIQNNRDSPIVIESILINIKNDWLGFNDDWIDKYLSNFIGVIILPHESFRFMFIGDEPFSEPVSDEFRIAISCTDVVEHRCFDVSATISFKFRDSFIRLINSDDKVKPNYTYSSISNTTNNYITNKKD